MFQFTCPSRSTTEINWKNALVLVVSIHVPLAEHDSSSCGGSGSVSLFQFTCPSRSTTVSQPATIVLMRVSIHVPLAEHDKHAELVEAYSSGFNSRAPRGARLDRYVSEASDFLFQFTCPSRSTTYLLNSLASLPSFQFTCPSRSTTLSS